MPIILILPACPAPGHNPGNLCRFVKCRLNSRMTWQPCPAVSYYVPPISSGIDGSPWVSYNYLETAKGLNAWFTVSAWVVLFYIRHSTSLNGVYFSLEYCGVEPTEESMSLLEPHLCTPSPAPLLTSDPSVYKARPRLISTLNPFCHSHLSRNFTVTGLCYAYFGTNMSAPICKMGSYSISRDCLAWPKFVKLSLHCCLHIIMYIPAWTSASFFTWRGKVPGGPPLQLWGGPSRTCDSQTS